MRGVILLNGDAPGLSLDFYKGKRVYCADGAYAWAHKQGIVCDVLLGDFDSLDPKRVPNPSDGVRVIRFAADKDCTDGELALNLALSEGCTAVDIVGAWGGREDHAFANLSLLYRARLSGADAVLYAAGSVVRCIGGAGDFTEKTEKGLYVSLVPFAGQLHIIDTEGLKYPIKDKVLLPEDSLGISNETTGSTVRIGIASGYGLLFKTFERVKH